jgi:hypothetical protein
MPDINVTVTSPVTRVVSVGNAASTDLANRLVQTGGYLESLITVSNAGVSSLNLRSGIVNLSGAGNITVIPTGQIIYISGAGSTGEYYPLNNPSGFITGIDTSNFVTLSQTGEFLGHNETGNLTNWFYPRNENPAGYLTGSVVRPSDTGIFADVNHVHPNTGNFVTTAQTGHNHDSQYYPLSSNPAGYVTGSVVRPSETGNFVTTAQTGHNHDAQYYPLSSNPSNYVTTNDTGVYANTFVAKSDTGHFVGHNETGVLLNEFVSHSETGAFASQSYVQGASGALNTRLESTGQNLLSLIQAASAGVSSLNGASGILTLTGAGGVVVTRNGQTITVSGGAAGDYVSKSETGQFVGHNETGTFADINHTHAGYVQTSETGAYANTFVSKSETGIFDNTFVSHAETGIYTNTFVPKSDTGHFVGHNETGVLLNEFVSHSETGNFAAIAYVNSVSGVLSTRLENTGAFITQLNSLTGEIGLSGSGNIVITSTGNNIIISNSGLAKSTELDSTGSYLYGLIQASSAGVSSLNSQSGSLTLTGAGGVSVVTLGQTIRISGDTSTYVTRSETGAYDNTFVSHAETGTFADVNHVHGNYVITSQTGEFVGHNETGDFYPRSHNPAGYLTSSNLNGYVQSSETGAYTNTFVTKAESGIFVGHNETGTFADINHTHPNTGSFVTAAQTGILVGKNETGIFDNTFVSHAETGAFASTLYVNGVSGALNSRLEATGQTLLSQIGSAVAGVSSVNGETGALTLTGLGNVTVTKVGTTIRISGNGSASSGPIATGNVFLRSMYLENPVHNENISWFYNKESVTLNSLVSLISGTGASLGWSLHQTTNRNLDGSLIVSGYTDSMTTGNLINSFSNATISGDVFVYFKSQSTGGAVSNFSLNLIGEEILLSGVSAGSYYPLTSNPSGYVQSSETGAYVNTFVTPAQTGAYTNTFVTHAQTGIIPRTITNLGSGEGLFASTVANDHRFKSLRVSSGLSISSNADTIIISPRVGDSTGIELMTNTLLPTAHQYHPIISGFVTSGVYMLTTRVNVGSTANAVLRATAKIWDGGSNVYCIHSTSCPAMGAGVSGYGSITMGDLIRATGVTNLIALSVAASVANNMVLSATNQYGTGAAAGSSTSIDLVRLF